MTAQPLEAWRFGMFFLIIFMTALVAQSIGLAVGAALSLQWGAILGPLFICPFLQFSGFFLQERDAPSFWRWTFNISFLKYSFDGGMLAIFGYNRERLDCNDIYCQFVHPKYILKVMDMEHANYQLAFFFLLGLLVMLRILAFYIMSFRLRLFRWKYMRLFGTFRSQFILMYIVYITCFNYVRQVFEYILWFLLAFNWDNHVPKNWTAFSVRKSWYTLCKCSN